MNLLLQNTLNFDMVVRLISCEIYDEETDLVFSYCNWEMQDKDVRRVPVSALSNDPDFGAEGWKERKKLQFCL